MTIRLSQSSFTGTERTEVAVGTVSETSMFCAVRAGAPRSTVYVGSSLAAAGAAGRDSFGTGLVVPLAGSAALVSGRGLATGAGVGVGSGACSWAGAGCFSDGLGRPPCGRRGAVVVPLVPPLAWPFDLKYVAHVGSTLPGSRWYWSNISSTNHSLAPKSADVRSDWLPGDCGTA